MLARQDLPTPPSRLHFAALVEALAAHYGPHSREVEPGRWAFEVLLGGHRSQVVHLALREAEDATGRDTSRLVVSSPVGALAPRTDFEALLRHNATLDVGAVAIEELRTDDGRHPYVVVRSAPLARAADADALLDTVERLARAADRLEKDLFAQDVF